MKLSMIMALTLLAGSWPAMAENKAKAYAAELKKLTDEYIKQVAKKSKAEQDAYDQAARLYARSAEQRSYFALTEDRLGLAMRQTEFLVDGSLTVNQLLFNELPGYAAHDFSVTKATFGSAMDTHLAYLANLESLDVDKKKAQALSAALDAMSKKGSLLDFVNDMQSYYTATQTQMKFSDCSLTLARSSVLKDQKARLQQSIDAAKAAGKATLQKQLQAQMDDLDSRIKGFDATLTATGVYDNTAKTCKTPR